MASTADTTGFFANKAGTSLVEATRCTTGLAASAATLDSTTLTAVTVGGHGVLYTRWKGIQQHLLPLLWHGLATNDWFDRASMEYHAGLVTWPQEWAPFPVGQQAVSDDFSDWWQSTSYDAHLRPNYDEYRQGADRVMYKVWKGTLDNACLEEWAYMSADERQETAQKAAYERRESARQRQGSSTPS